MRIDEAIKLLNELQSLLPDVGFNKYTASVKLGIEALKRVIDGRGNLYPFSNVQLEGETELALWNRIKRRKTNV